MAGQVLNWPRACAHPFPRENRSLWDPGSPEIEVEAGALRTPNMHSLTRSGMAMQVVPLQRCSRIFGAVLLRTGLHSPAAPAAPVWWSKLSVAGCLGLGLSPDRTDHSRMALVSVRRTSGLRLFDATPRGTGNAPTLICRYCAVCSNMLTYFLLSEVKWCWMSEQSSCLKV